MNSTQTKYVRSPEIPFQFLEGKALVLTPDSQMAHELNESATEIFKILECASSFAEIISALGTIYEASEIERHTGEIEQTLNEMIEKRIIQRQ